MSEAQLMILLQKEIELLEKLNELSLIKKEALFMEDLSRLEAILNEENFSFREFKTIDDACLPQVQFFLKGNSIFSENDAEIKGQLLKLRGLAAKLQTNNRLNMELIQDSLSYVRFTLNILTTMAQEKASTYSAFGKVVGKVDKKRLLDFKG
jgi:hypothetical protein